jgi:hypothetical protein
MTSDEKTSDPMVTICYDMIERIENRVNAIQHGAPMTVKSIERIVAAANEELFSKFPWLRAKGTAMMHVRARFADRWINLFASNGICNGSQPCDYCTICKGPHRRQDHDRDA